MHVATGMIATKKPPLQGEGLDSAVLNGLPQQPVGHTLRE